MPADAPRQSFTAFRWHLSWPTLRTKPAHTDFHGEIMKPPVLLGGFRGAIGNNWEYDTSISYSSNNVVGIEHQPYCNKRFADAINGLGGPNLQHRQPVLLVSVAASGSIRFSTRFTRSGTFANDPSD